MYRLLQFARPGMCVTVKLDDTLETASRTIHDKRVHRAYICDEQMKPIGICSIKEILLELLDSMLNTMGTSFSSLLLLLLPKLPSSNRVYFLTLCVEGFMNQYNALLILASRTPAMQNKSR